MNNIDKAQAKLELEELVQEIRARDPVERRYHAEAGGIGLWCAVYFDMPGSGPMHLYPHQKEIANAIIDPNGPKRINLREPRYHGKTETIIRPVLSWIICHDRSATILLINKDGASAKKSLRVIKEELATNKRLIEDYGAFKPTGKDAEKSWTGTTITVIRDHIQRDATVEAVGAGGSIVGGHFRYIIPDDIEDIDSARSETKRRHVKEWHSSTVIPMLHPNGKFCNVATRKHYDDYTGWLDKDPTFFTIERKAIIEWPESWEIAYKHNDGGELILDTKGNPVIDQIDVVGGGKVLWPQMWPMEKLILQYASMMQNKRIFLMEYQQEVGDEELALVKLAWLEAALARGEDHGWYTQEEADARGWLVFQGWDLALVDDKREAEAHDTDYTVGMTWGLDLATQDRYLMNIFRNRGLTQGQLAGVIKTEAARYPNRVVIMVERNAFGQLVYMGVKRTTDLPVYGHYTGGNKTDAYEGLPRIAMLYENDKIILPGQEARPLVDVLINETHGLGNEAHDDMPMAHWICEQGIMAWIEKKIKREHNTSSASFGDYDSAQETGAA